jgi:hypothetical protein
MIITLVFEKNANFFAENCQKSQKIVIISSTPGLNIAQQDFNCWFKQTLMWNFLQFRLLFRQMIKNVCLYVKYTNYYSTKWLLFISTAKPNSNRASLKAC